MPENAVFVVFEGLDGAGKTSCAKQTAELLGARYMTTPSLALRQHRDAIIASFDGSQEAAHMFYLATVMAASEEVKSCLARGQSVVLDRYFLSTQVYAKFRGSVLEVYESVGKLLLPADWTVFLGASLNVRQSRALERGCSMADGETMTNDANARLLQGYEQRIHHPVIGQRMRIDTSAMSVQEISQQVVTKILSSEAALVGTRY